MKQIVKEIWHDIRTGQNLDIYINVSVALIFTVLALLGIVDQKIISPAILGILALLLASLLVNRRDSSRIRAAISELEKVETLPEKFLSNKYDRQELAQALCTAHKAFFWGLDFAMLIPGLSTDIQWSLKNGTEVRFLLVEPDSSAGRMATFARPEQTENEFNTAIKANLNHLSRLANNASPGKLAFRTVDYYPALNITAFDPHLPTGWMLVRMASFRQRFPTFKLTRAQDEKWFEHIVQQFEALWSEAKEVVVDGKN
jgi:hypothetical protein